MCEPVGQVLPLGRMPSNSSHCLQLWQWDCSGQGLWSRGGAGHPGCIRIPLDVGQGGQPPKVGQLKGDKEVGRGQR